MNKAKGLFIDGVWHCDCTPRIPADHFQTKNGGKNHGRWCTLADLRKFWKLTFTVYTCQRPQHKRCKFYLWDDEATRREKIAVLNNTRSEPRTPSKTVSAQLASPQSLRQASPNVPEIKDEDFSWSSEDDEEFVKAEADFAPETPSKAAKVDYFSSPTKRKRSVIDDDVFITTKNSGLPTPTKATGSLTKDVLNVLKPVSFSKEIEADLVSLLERHEIELRGAIKGRDFSRDTIKVKDKKIAELSSRIAGLEGERETSKAVIAHLKRDIVEGSPKARRKK